MGLISTLRGLLFKPVTPAGLPISKDATTSTLLNHARALDLAGRRDEAAAIYWDMLDKDIGELGAAQNLSDLLIRQCQFDDAVLVMAAVLDHAPSFSPLWCNFSAALSAIGDHERATLAADRACSTDPANSMAYYNRGKCFWQNGQRQQAIADYERANLLAPSNVEIAQQLHLARFAVSDAIHDIGPVKHEMRAHGAFIADGMEIASTLMCPHCGCHFPSLRKSHNKCLNCADYTCDSIACVTSCNPYLRQLEEAATASARLRTG